MNIQPETWRAWRGVRQENVLDLIVSWEKNEENTQPLGSQCTVSLVFLDVGDVGYPNNCHGSTPI